MTITSADNLGVEIEVGVRNPSGALQRLVEDDGDLFYMANIAWRKDGPVAGHHASSHIRTPYKVIANVR